MRISKTGFPIVTRKNVATEATTNNRGELILPSKESNINNKKTRNKMLAIKKPAQLFSTMNMSAKKAIISTIIMILRTIKLIRSASDKLFPEASSSSALGLGGAVESKSLFCSVSCSFIISFFIYGSFGSIGAGVRLGISLRRLKGPLSIGTT